MASLTEQMEELKRQYDNLAKKIHQEENKKNKRHFTINRLEELNEKQSESIKNHKSKHIYARQRQQINIITNPRFQVILEILKKQNTRIAELEAIIQSNNNINNNTVEWSCELPINR